MKPIKSIEEFRQILTEAKKQHEKLKLDHISLPLLEKAAKKFQEFPQQ